MPQEKRKIISPSAQRTRGGAQYGTAEHPRAGGAQSHPADREQRNAPAQSSADRRNLSRAASTDNRSSSRTANTNNRASSPRIGNAGARSGGGYSHISSNEARSGTTITSGESRGGTRTSGTAPRSRSDAQPYGATFRFQKITPEMSAKYRAQQHDSSGNRPASHKSGTAASGGASSRSLERRGGTSVGIGRRRSKPLSTPSPSGAAVIRSRLTARRMPTIRTVQSRVVRRFPFKLIFTAALCTVLFLLVIYNNVQINEKNSEVDGLKTTIVKLDSEVSELNLKVEKKNDLRKIEQRALELGMVKADELKKVYVSISSADRVELVDEDNGNTNSFRMTGLFEQVRDFFLGLFGLDDGGAETSGGSSGDSEG